MYQNTRKQRMVKVMVFKHQGRVYSISDKNSLGEFVVVQVKVTQRSRKVESARIIQGSTKESVAFQVRTQRWNSFRVLPVEGKKETIDMDENKTLH